MGAQEILFVSHCILNTAAKVRRVSAGHAAQEEQARIAFLRRAVERGVQLVQLPCPEFTLYGPDRWGHTREQFDNPFFRAHCRQLLDPVLQQLQAYLHPREGTRFHILGIVGIEGSPSCGVCRTCSGRWGGELGGRTDLAETAAQVRSVPGMGVLMEELAQLLRQHGVQLPIVGLDGRDIQPLYDLLRGAQDGAEEGEAP